jgi:uncharacterized protein
MLGDIPLFIAAFLTGFFGSIHCIGMCGGIVGALTMGLGDNIRRSWWRLWPYLMAYNVGRISTYVIMGLIIGFIGTLTQQTTYQHTIHLWVSGLFMLALGLYIGGWWQFLAKLERAGAWIWHWIAPLGKNFLPVKNPLHALGLGLVWGWLPCGLVYAALGLALAGGNTVQGGWIMLSFGLGTLPMLLVMGATAQWLIQLSRHIIMRQLAGGLIILFAILTLTELVTIHPSIDGMELCAICVGNYT